MKQRLLTYLRTLILWLERLQKKYTGHQVEKLPYTSLSPIDDADIGEDYKTSLDWALKNRKKLNIRNIALTGPYGSGKSSIIKTYIARHNGSDLHFLDIS